jgi:hypothetical protein
VGVVQIGAGKGRTFHMGVIGVALTVLGMGQRDILEVRLKNACVLSQRVHHLQSCYALDTSVQAVQQFQFLLLMILHRVSFIH